MSAGLAVVTGAAGGIGAAIARRLGQGGYQLLLVDRDPAVEKAAETLADQTTVAATCVVDLTELDAVDRVGAAVDATGVPLRVLVNNAGITRDARVGDMEPPSFTLVVSVNLLAPMRLTLGLADRFSDGAAVVNISSRAALGNFGQVNYVASKAGLVGFTRALALRWAPRVRVNAVLPGLIDTPMTQDMPERVLNKLVGRIPLGRMGTPDDIAEAVFFLASDTAGYITGQTLLSCGGRSLAP